MSMRELCSSHLTTEGSSRASRTACGSLETESCVSSKGTLKSGRQASRIRRQKLFGAENRSLPRPWGRPLPKRSTSRRREPSRAQAKSGERRRRAAARESERRREEADRNVADLEEQVKSLEAKLARASERRDVDAVTRLGREYEEAQAALERAVEEWAEVAS